MIVYFKSYVVLVCGIAIALPVVYSTVYPMMTGELVASSLSGLITLFVLFILGLLLGFGIFERKAQAKADSWVALYNDQCDPEAFLREGADLAEGMRPPYNQVSAWYMGYYAQAYLDSGDTHDAKAVLDALLSSIESARKPAEKVGIIVNTIPLLDKIEGAHAALGLVDRGFDICAECKGSAVSQYREFLESQSSVLNARVSGDARKALEMDESVWHSQRYPRRIRVEYAWDGASAAYSCGESATEKEALEYVADNGGELALAQKAEDRLSSIS